MTSVPSTTSLVDPPSFITMVPLTSSKVAREESSEFAVIWMGMKLYTLLSSTSMVLERNSTGVSPVFTVKSFSQDASSAVRAAAAMISFIFLISVTC